MGLKNFSYNAAGEVLSEFDAEANLIEMEYDRLGRLTLRKANSEVVGEWHFDGAGPNKGLGLLDYEDSRFQSDSTRLQKHYFYGDGSNGRKDLQQVTHRIFHSEATDSNGDYNDFADYETQYFADTFYARPKGMHYPGGTKLAQLYDIAGYLTHEKDPASGLVYRQTTARNARNQMTGASLGNSAMALLTSYNQPTGQMSSHSVSAGTPIVNFGYTYDIYGNLDVATTTVNGVVSSEDLDYDSLHRMTTSTRNTPAGSQILSLTYDPAGNITSKSDYATLYQYQTAGPNAVSSVNLVGGGTASFSYDGNGNMTVGHGKTMVYNAFNKPVTINVGGSVVDAFSYGADLMRYRHEKGTGKVTWYLDKYMEIINVGSTWDYRHYISDVAILTKTGALNDPNPSIDFVHRDRLGNVVKLTNASGGLPSSQDTDYSGRGFDPYGKPRNEDWSDRSSPPTGSKLERDETERGFTDHEHLDEAELIHMNGRAFDYNLGRFISIDPFIQAPDNSQSLNPYSYLMNNPLAGVDPSGYLSCRASRIGAESGSACGSTSISLQAGEGDDSKKASGTLGVWEPDNGATEQAPSTTNDDRATGNPADEKNGPGAIASGETGGGGSSSRRELCKETMTCDTVRWAEDMHDAGENAGDVLGEVLDAAKPTPNPAGKLSKVGKLRDKLRRYIKQRSLRKAIPKDVVKKVDANISRSGETVLGHWDDEYVAMAQGRGASYFDLGSETWEALSDAERLAANQYFLEVIAENGDTVLLSTSKANIRIPSALADEVNYLIKELGYTWYDQLTLLPGN